MAPLRGTTAGQAATLTVTWLLRLAPANGPQLQKGLKAAQRLPDPFEVRTQGTQDRGRGGAWQRRGLQHRCFSAGVTHPPSFPHTKVNCLSHKELLGYQHPALLHRHKSSPDFASMASCNLCYTASFVPLSLSPLPVNPFITQNDS